MPVGLVYIHPNGSFDIQGNIHNVCIFKRLDMAKRQCGPSDWQPSTVVVVLRREPSPHDDGIKHQWQ